MKTYNEFLTENNKFLSLTSEIVSKIDWQKKPKKSVQSAEHTMQGTTKKGHEVAFSWHQPGRYSDSYQFLGMYVSKNFKSIDPPKEAKTGGMMGEWYGTDDIMKDDINDAINRFKKAIDAAKKL